MCIRNIIGFLTGDSDEKVKYYFASPDRKVIATFDRYEDAILYKKNNPRKPAMRIQTGLFKDGEFVGRKHR